MSASTEVPFPQSSSVKNTSREHDGRLSFSITNKATLRIVSHQSIQETSIIMNYYSSHSDSLAGEPSHGAKVKITGLLPIVSNDRTEFASIMAFLTALMPDD